MCTTISRITYVNTYARGTVHIISLIPNLKYIPPLLQLCNNTHTYLCTYVRTLLGGFLRHPLLRRRVVVSSSAVGTVRASSNLCPGAPTGSQVSGTEYNESTRTLNRLLHGIDGGSEGESIFIHCE